MLQYHHHTSAYASEYTIITRYHHQHLSALSYIVILILQRNPHTAASSSALAAATSYLLRPCKSDESPRLAHDCREREAGSACSATSRRANPRADVARRQQGCRLPKPAVGVRGLSSRISDVPQDALACGHATIWCRARLRLRARLVSRVAHPLRLLFAAPGLEDVCAVGPRVRHSHGEAHGHAACRC